MVKAINNPVTNAPTDEARPTVCWGEATVSVQIESTPLEAPATVEERKDAETHQKPTVNEKFVYL